MITEINNLIEIHPRDIMVTYGPTKLFMDRYHWHSPRKGVVASYTPIRRDVEDHFDVFRHRVSDFKRRLQTSGFEIEVERHFYLTLPRPLDRVFPAAAQRVESFFDRYMEASVRHLAEGYIAVARKSGSSPSPIVAESVTAG
jgi:hypothetical protein